MKRVIVLTVVLLIIGLSLLAIQYAPGSESPLKGMLPGTIEQIKSPLKGFY